MTAKQQNTSANKEKGFTLVEILISLTIFAIGILGIASMQAWGLRGNASAIRHSEAATLATDQIEQLMTVPYDALISGVPTQTTASTTVQQGNYGITWTVTPDIPIDLTTKITVNVTWADQGTMKTFSPAPGFTFYRALIGPD